MHECGRRCARPLAGHSHSTPASWLHAPVLVGPWSTHEWSGSERKFIFAPLSYTLCPLKSRSFFANTRGPRFRRFLADFRPGCFQPFNSHELHSIQGHLVHKKTRPPRTLQQDCAQGLMVFLGKLPVSFERGTPVGGLNISLIPEPGNLND